MFFLFNFSMTRSRHPYYLSFIINTPKTDIAENKKRNKSRQRAMKGTCVLSLPPPPPPLVPESHDDKADARARVYICATLSPQLSFHKTRHNRGETASSAESRERRRDSQSRYIHTHTRIHIRMNVRTLARGKGKRRSERRQPAAPIERKREWSGTLKTLDGKIKGGWLPRTYWKGSFLSERSCV